jgi:hypothetical protein
MDERTDGYDERQTPEQKDWGEIHRIVRGCRSEVNHMMTQICSKCYKEKLESDFSTIKKDGRRSKVCIACQNARRLRMIRWRMENTKCGVCGGPPTARDRKEDEARLVKYLHNGKHKPHCSNCLCPELTDEILYGWMMSRINEREHFVESSISE